ncbi:hypothetical protein H072_2886 [Dactylellina haptotyla CBS 200.50]|uniref:Protein kinase domain-containing protein n=1 Tax=Dactylellina haptotyla (strain CBS 200.50) TaxID=1284197 RepID=S8AJJ4_DACHA|nr:hypothetical protein H072_2886 [Dactylellina haptotyla CBS 200.50]
MVGVELALAIIATVDLAFKYGELLVNVCATFRAAEYQVSILVTRIESSWIRTKCQLEFLQKVVHLMQSDHQRIQKEILDKLNETLQAAISHLSGVVDKNSCSPVKFGAGQEDRGRYRDIATEINRFKYVFKKEKLEKSVEDLESWQRLFDPSWFLIMTIANPIVDQQLADANRLNSNSGPNERASSYKTPASKAAALRSARDREHATGGVFRPANGIDQSTIRKIQSTSALVAQRNGFGEYMILDPVPCPPDANTQMLTKSIRDLARKLMNADPEVFGLLRCKGVIKKSHPPPRSNSISAFVFIFEIPVGLSEPQGLQSLLADSEHLHSLSHRLQVAKDLAKAVNYIHMFGYVHKNIRSENIVILKDGKSDIGSAFLVGFEEIRLAEGDSRRLGDSILERNIYRHPERQGPNPREYYIMQHDIYSLGVCLLEIGLWVSLADTLTNVGIRSLGAPPPYTETPSSPTKAQPMPTEDQTLIKNQLLRQARENLPRKMGNNYARVVETCLTCLDPGNEDFGDEAALEDEDGVLVSVRYIEKVLEKLEAINM